MQRQVQFEKKTTDRELNDFLQSNVWKDFSAIMEMRIQAIQDELSHAADMEQVRRLQGELQGVRFWESFPKELAEAIMQEKENATEANPE